MIALDEAQRWADYVATLSGPMVTTTIKLTPADDSHTFTVDSVQHSDDGFLIDARDDDGDVRLFRLRVDSGNNAI